MLGWTERQEEEKGDHSWWQMLEIMEEFISGMWIRVAVIRLPETECSYGVASDQPACGLLRRTHNRHPLSFRPQLLQTVPNWGRTHNNPVRITGAMVNGRIHKNREHRHKRSVPGRLDVGPKPRTRLLGSRSGVVERIHCPWPMAKRRSRYHELAITKL